MADYGYSPYQEARLSTRQRLGAALQGLSAVPRGANWAEALLAGFGGGARSVSAAQQAAQEYAMKQQQAQEEKDFREIQKAEILARTEQLKKPPTPEKSDIPWAYRPENWNLPGAADVRKKDTYIAPTADKKEKLVQIEADDGSTIYVPESQAVGKKVGGKVKPPSSIEKAKAGVLRAATAAETNIRAQEDKFGKMNTWQQIKLGAPNIAQSEDEQKYTQAANWWIENILREVSGAVINVTEYPQYRKIYFTQPGDKPGLKEQKRASRAVILEKYKTMGGEAAKDVPGIPVGAFDPGSARSKYGY